MRARAHTGSQIMGEGHVDTRVCGQDRVPAMPPELSETGEETALHYLQRWGRVHALLIMSQGTSTANGGQTDVIS